MLVRSDSSLLLILTAIYFRSCDFWNLLQLPSFTLILIDTFYFYILVIVLPPDIIYLLPTSPAISLDNRLSNYISANSSTVEIIWYRRLFVSINFKILRDQYNLRKFWTLILSFFDSIIFNRNRTIKKCTQCKFFN